MRSLSLLPRSGPPRFLRKPRKEKERTTVAYAAGLAGVGMATALLPVSYLAVCGGVLWLLREHLIGNSGWLLGGSAGLLSGVAYLSIALWLAMLSLFLFRPLLSERGRSKADLPLSPADEPRLHAFILKVCTTLGAPAPTRIRVSMDVNASARLAVGWRNYWDGSLELVLGLPLVRGLELGQFAAVLAHELGHFRQGAAMRLVHGIRSLNHWFSRAAAREDAWERDLAKRSHRLDPLLYLPYGAARACSWTARLILGAHYRAGQAASCVLLRQMEHQADDAAVRLVGGETFASMVLEAKVIESAWGLANRSLGLALREGRLADDLPALVAAHTRVFIPEVRRKMERSLLSEKTALFDTHPSLAERVRRARRSPARGLFRSAGPSHFLFTDFPALSRRATVSFYRRDLGEDFNPSRMMPTHELVTGQSEVQIGESAVSGYFLGLLTNLRPIWLSGSDFGGIEAQSDPAALDAAERPAGTADWQACRVRLEDARERIESGHPGAAEMYKGYASADSRMLDAVQALALMRANFWIEPGDFQLRKGSADQAASAFREAEADQARLSSRLAAFEDAMRLRLDSALRLLSDPGVAARLPDAVACSEEVIRMLPILEALGKVQPRLESLRRSFHGMSILLENLDGNESAPEVEAQLRTHALAMRLDLEAVAAAFSGLEYPFASPGGAKGLREYALDGFPSERDYGAHYAAAEELLGRCYALYFRIFGRLALAAGRVEGVLGLGPLKVDA